MNELYRFVSAQQEHSAQVQQVLHGFGIGHGPVGAKQQDAVKAFDGQAASGKRSSFVMDDELSIIDESVKRDSFTGVES